MKLTQETLNLQRKNEALDTLSRELSKQLNISRKKEDISKKHIHELTEKLNLNTKNFIDLSDKFKSINNETIEREKSTSSLIKTQSDQIQLYKENGIKSQKVLENLSNYSSELLEKLKVSSEQEISLKKEIQDYKTQFLQVEVTLKNTNTLIENFKLEMEHLKGTVKVLKKENLSLKEKFALVNTNALLMVQERDSSLKVIQKLTLDNEKLKNLCRALHKGIYL